MSSVSRLKGVSISPLPSIPLFGATHLFWCSTFSRGLILNNAVLYRHWNKWCGSKGTPCRCYVRRCVLISTLIDSLTTGTRDARTRHAISHITVAVRLSSRTVLGLCRCTHTCYHYCRNAHQRGKPIAKYIGDVHTLTGVFPRYFVPSSSPCTHEHQDVVLCRVLSPDLVSDCGFYLVLLLYVSCFDSSL